MLLFGTHYENWGDVILWSIASINIASILFLLVLVSMYFRATQPETLAAMATPLREFCRQEVIRHFLLQGYAKRFCITVTAR